MNRAQWAMVKKDVGETTGSTQTFAPLLIVPLVMMVILPLALVIGAQFGESALGGMNGFDQLLKHFGDRLDRAVSRLAISIVTAALIVGSAIVMTVEREPSLPGLPSFGLLGFIAAVIGGIWVLVSIWRGGKGGR